MATSDRTVLLVEDSPSDVALTREVFRQVMPSVGLEVCNDGVEALEHLRGLGDGPAPDLILLDLNMPRMGGLEVLDNLKAHPVWRRIPVVVLTTSKAETDILGTYERYANSFITKPVDLNEFIEVVTQINGYWMKVVQLPTV